MKKHIFLLLILAGCTLGASATVHQRGNRAVAQGNTTTEYRSGEQWGRQPADPLAPADSAATDTAHRDTAGAAYAGYTPYDSTATDSTRNEPAAPAQGSDGQAASIIMMGLCIVSLILGLLAYLKSAKAMKETAKRMKVQQAETNQKADDLARKLNQLTKDHQELEQRIITLAMQRQQAPQLSPQQAPQQPKSTQSPAAFRKAPEAPTVKTGYAWSVTDGSFGKNNCSPTLNSHTMAILTCGSDGRGTFVINSAPQVQAELLSNAHMGIMLIAEVQRKVSFPTRIVTLKAGEMELQDGRWRVTRKAQIALE